MKKLYSENYVHKLGSRSMKVILHLRSEAQAIITTLKGNEERSRQGNQIILHPCGKKKHGKPKRPIENHFK